MRLGPIREFGRFADWFSGRDTSGPCMRVDSTSCLALPGWMIRPGLRNPHARPEKFPEDWRVESSIYEALQLYFCVFFAQHINNTSTSICRSVSFCYQLFWICVWAEQEEQRSLWIFGAMYARILLRTGGAGGSRDITRANETASKSIAVLAAQYKPVLVVILFAVQTCRNFTRSSKASSKSSEFPRRDVRTCI